MVVELHSHPFGGFQGKGFRCQRVEGRSLGLLKELSAADLQPLEGLVIVHFQKLPDRLVQLLKAVEGPVSQGSIDPLVHQANSIFDERFIPGFAYPGGNDHRAVVFAKLGKLRVDLRVIGVAAAHGATQIVRDQCISRTAHIPNRPFIRTDPLLLLLTFGTLHIGQSAGPQNGHKHLHRPLLAPFPIEVAQFLSSVVDKHLVPDFVLDVHPHLRVGFPLLKVVAELGVLKALRMFPFVLLLPQPLQRHPCTPQFHNKEREVLGKLPVLATFFDPWPFNPLHKLTVSHLLNLFDLQIAGLKILPILGHHRTRDTQCPGNLSITHSSAGFQSNYISDLFHPNPLLCHSISFETCCLKADTT
ncbi:hypothetical protein ES708_14048 [subsurface metagenome]